MEALASEALKSAYSEAEREVQYAGVKHTDATSWTRAGKLMSLWTLGSVAATVYRIFADGCRETIRPLFGPAKGILVSDRAKRLYVLVDVLSPNLFRTFSAKFVAFSERAGRAGAIGRELLEYTSLVFEYWHGYKDGILTRSDVA